MAKIQIGSTLAEKFKVGGSDCKLYLGETLVYPQNSVVAEPNIYEYIYTTSSDVRDNFIINTNFYPLSWHKIETKIMVTASKDWGAIFGWCESSNETSDTASLRLSTVGSSSNSILLRYGVSNGIRYRAMSTGVTHVVKVNVAKTSAFTVDNTAYSANTGSYTLPPSKPLCIYGFGEGTARYNFIGRMYYLKVSDSSGNVVKNYVPSDYNGTPCFYETVDGDYILNTSSGELFLGNKIST